MQSSAPSPPIPFEIAKKRGGFFFFLFLFCSSANIYAARSHFLAHSASSGPWFWPVIYDSAWNSGRGSGQESPAGWATNLWGGLADRMQIVFPSGENSRHARSRISSASAMKMKISQAYSRQVEKMSKAHFFFFFFLGNEMFWWDVEEKTFDVERDCYE